MDMNAYLDEVEGNIAYDELAEFNECLEVGDAIVDVLIAHMTLTEAMELADMGDGNEQTQAS